MNLFKVVYKNGFLSVRVAPSVEKYFKLVSNGQTFTSKNWNNTFYSITADVAEELEKRFKVRIFAVGNSLLDSGNIPNLSILRVVNGARYFQKIRVLDCDIDNIAIYFLALHKYSDYLEKLSDFINEQLKNFEKNGKLGGGF